ncbi:YodC family protein [Burkholderia sp. SCN-KJ]|uniref:YodC family protein n=1 Tax=Burkholderia sp. SCN-KJ TaxID=2969248 RepID=UPI0021502528|nr:YodC family protein [Burkholderia sp. SCN-KJ]MCR4465444.1 YodC family protein [Burkholderia sp. SCN-KJ]
MMIRENHRSGVRVGDVVTLKTGGPRMTVTYAGPVVFDDADWLICQWFDDSGHFRQEMFHHETVVPEPRAISAGRVRVRMQGHRYRSAA